MIFLPKYSNELLKTRLSGRSTSAAGGGGARARYLEGRADKKAREKNEKGCCVAAAAAVCGRGGGCACGVLKSSPMTLLRTTCAQWR